MIDPRRTPEEREAPGEAQAPAPVIVTGSDIISLAARCLVTRVCTLGQHLVNPVSESRRRVLPPGSPDGVNQHALSV